MLTSPGFFFKEANLFKTKVDRFIDCMVLTLYSIGTHFDATTADSF